MLAEPGVSLVEIDHAERRQHFGEDNAMIARKVTAAAAAGLTPLLGAAEPATAGYVTDVVRLLRERHSANGMPELPALDGVSGLFLGRFAHYPANFGKVLDEALALDLRLRPGPVKRRDTICQAIQKCAGMTPSVMLSLCNLGSAPLRACRKTNYMR